MEKLSRECGEKRGVQQRHVVPRLKVRMEKCHGQVQGLGSQPQAALVEEWMAAWCWGHIRVPSRRGGTTRLPSLKELGWRLSPWRESRVGDLWERRGWGRGGA